ncbi:acetyl/propionyl/methylcrotonyl-CoA carboxylase subunit alpha [Paracoccus sp. SCSIO 75233]|uniref:acetyl-CoA carboxylase biotin carboxylase subunit n=1 Tax=Paracoccus sp. SCSIO 75233 TaxID=3017782 RepID=UPI0022F092E9|nr:acetyl/propionyl/methylcrotonyl-CoA carboxylase subunit alpha [Paracoccus sp. SCSIO 75233]WBU54232.1 acetyl/propionyl/methylcrotonyl-CoA carboxylase subunit alpha [Paracoccus sp. SCSIO 75233]
MFKKILIANRGEIACRIIKTARKMGIATVAVYSDADRHALHVKMADEAVHIGPAQASQSYIDIDRIMTAIRESGADAVHPGYGFLSENRRFAEALAAEGVTFIGPPAAAIEAMGDKITSKKIADEAGVSTVPGHMGLITDAEDAVRIAAQIGYPVMIKASAGGGGKGMRIAWNDDDARAGFQSSKNEAAASFGDDRIFIEKFVTSPRHIEIQLLADSHGKCVYLHERECSIQRRNQKVIEEAPSPFLDPKTRAAMGEQAVRLAQAVGYVSAGTVEFIVDAARNFYFLEMNTRLQVEHPVTELISGIDLVEQMIRVAAGEPLAFAQQDLALNGWAIESRVYAEDPYRGFLPSTGRLTRYQPPEEQQAGPLAQAGNWVPAVPDAAPPEAATGIRNDTGVYEGGEISVFYDPMIAKLCSWAPSREQAIETMRGALNAFEIDGIGHNIPFLSAVMDHPKFIAGDISTGFIAEEYPTGFHGTELPERELHRIAAAASAMYRVTEIRRSRISGRLGNHERKVGSDWVVCIGDQEFETRIDADRAGSTVTVAGRALRVVSDWVPGRSLARMTVEGRPLVMKVDRISAGFRLRTSGADLAVHVRTPRAARLARLMPVIEKPDQSKLLLCPMPGLVQSIAVSEGDTVEEGQPLATIEAMKMENILRAETRGVVKRIAAEPGQSLKVDDIIMEFA